MLSVYQLLLNILKIEAASSFIRLLPIHQSTQRHIPAIVNI